MSDSYNEKLLKAREILLRSKIYKWLTVVFAVFGFLVFIMVYAKQYRGDVMVALGNPWIVASLLIPFLPAFVLSLMTSKEEKKLEKAYEELAALKGDKKQ